MEKVATDIYSFARIREEGFTYVDKTEELYAMASGDAGAQFFMARPRRFGKSLAVSTLKSPNLGIESSFLSCVASAYTGKDDVASANYAFEAAAIHSPIRISRQRLPALFTRTIPMDMSQSAAHRLPSQEDYHRRQYAETVIGGTGRRFESTYPG